MSRVSGIRARIQATWARFIAWYRRAGKGAQVGVGCGALIIICACCSFGLAAVNAAGGSSNSPTTVSHHTATTGATRPPAPPTDTPTPRATATPTPKPTATPIPLAVAITCASAVDYNYGKVCVHTHPGAQVYMTISYCSGKAADSASLKQAHTADSNGDTSWTWTPNTNCKGAADAIADVTWNGQSAEADKTFTVQ